MQDHQTTGVETGNQQITVISIANVFPTTVFHTLQCERDNITTQITLCVNTLKNKLLTSSGIVL